MIHPHINLSLKPAGVFLTKFSSLRVPRNYMESNEWVLYKDRLGSQVYPHQYPYAERVGAGLKEMPQLCFQDHLRILLYCKFRYTYLLDIVYELLSSKRINVFDAHTFLARICHRLNIAINTHWANPLSNPGLLHILLNDTNLIEAIDPNQIENTIKALHT